MKNIVLFCLCSNCEEEFQVYFDLCGQATHNHCPHCLQMQQIALRIPNELEKAELAILDINKIFKIETSNKVEVTGFKTRIFIDTDIEKLKEKVIDIWSYPKKYFSHSQRGEEAQRKLKFIFVVYPDGNKKEIAKYVSEECKDLLTKQD